MKRGCLVVLVLPVVVVLALVAAYPLLYPTYVVRYRLTINAVVEGQQHSGSSVVETRVKLLPRIIAEVGPWEFKTVGEAAFVDLGGGRNLVALLGPGPSEGKDWVTILFRAFGVPFYHQHAADLTKLDGMRRVRTSDWPPFVTFENVSDPLSMKPVNPSALRDAYGLDAHIESVTVEITQDPVTRGLEQRLPWLASPLTDRQRDALAKIHFSIGQIIRRT